MFYVSGDLFYSFLRLFSFILDVLDVDEELANYLLRVVQRCSSVLTHVRLTANYRTDFFVYGADLVLHLVDHVVDVREGLFSGEERVYVVYYVEIWLVQGICTW